MTADPDLVVLVRLAGPSLSAAGLAAWVLAQGDHEAATERTADLQDRIDEALRTGAGQVSVPRAIVSQALDLWQHAERLRVRAESLSRPLK